ncbi:Sodium bicarbonate transporter-like protein 11 [Armadillidium nasatum]|uniref:Sodium bicarbonate transporter-like protein 11 n=1 Tax=Armadillidium nasatum TaxID=96803 RepID=A0A5N5TNB4_9CRUS|nr:Sodium bicarbonate transporter-like protein 11 [Armadillidium nasatum]
MYCAVGLWSCFFLALYSLFDVSKLMKFSTRSTEEIFALFITIAFCHDAFTDVAKNFAANYNSEACEAESVLQMNGSYNVLPENASAISLLTFSLQNQTSNLTLLVNEASNCTRENSILFLLLMFGTLWLGLLLYNFNKTPYLNANKREILADYALPVAVVVFSFIGSLGFSDVKLKSEIQEIKSTDYSSIFQVAPLGSLPVSAIFATMGLGFCLSVLIFMDQNIGSAMVNNPGNKLKKGIAYHLDLLAVAIMNSFLSIFGLPWMHACIPHSPLHVRSLADVEERVDEGHVHEIIVKVRETRLTSLFPNILIGLSIFLLPYPLGYIPTAVLDGLFLYMALTALIGNQMHRLIPLVIDRKYLAALDGQHQ